MESFTSAASALGNQAKGGAADAAVDEGFVMGVEEERRDDSVEYEEETKGGETEDRGAEEAKTALLL